MKKLTYLLAFFVLLYTGRSLYGQSTIFVRAPVYYPTIQPSLPIELFVAPYTNACYLITAPELAALTGSNITSVGIHLFIGNVYAIASGTISIYMQNTSDINYAKGNSFSSCIAGMTNVYSGATSIAATSGTTDVTCPVASPFIYTGGGLYVAFSWSAGVSSTPFSLYSYGLSGSSYGVINYQNNPSSGLGIMNTTAYRPTFVFGLANTATNEAGVDALLAPGKVAEALHASQVVQANIRNISVNTLSNVQVSLSVSGVSNFSDLQVIPSLSPGAVTTVSFAAYTPTALGTNTLMVTIPADQYPANNQMSWTQSVTCSQTANGPPESGYANPISFQGILAAKFNFGAAATMSAVRLGISSTGLNDVVHGVLLDHNGAVIARTNTITITNGMPYTFQTFSFALTQTLQANTDYYIGMALPIANLSTMGCSPRFSDGVPPGEFAKLPLAGGTPTTLTGNYYGVEPVLNGTINITPSTSVICQGETIVLIPNGASTYAWSNSAGTNLASLANGSLVVTPVSYDSYLVKGTDAAGCSGQASKLLNVVVCNGIPEVVAHDGVSLYPNPVVNGQFVVSGLQTASTFVIYSMLGEEVLIKTVQTETVRIELPALPSGCYYLKMTSPEGRSKLIKFINRD